MRLLHFVGKLNVEIYKAITPDIASDEVIITETQIEHIKSRHADDFERFSNYFAKIIAEPDFIIKANKPNTAVVLKEIEVDDKKLKMVLRLKTSDDPVDYKNSIITFHCMNQKRFERLLRQSEILYRREDFCR